jgi:hypothetical protein
MFYRSLVAHHQGVYRDIGGKPCLVGTTETVGVELELIAFSSEEHVATYAPGEPLPAHSFITRHIGGENWVIAANACRIPSPAGPRPSRNCLACSSTETKCRQGRRLVDADDLRTVASRAPRVR